MAKQMHSINLVPNKGDVFLMQFLNWALTVGRLLVILVETLALGTFIYRFSIDYQIVDKKDEVKRQSSIVASFKSQEEVFRNLQSRLELIKNYDLESRTKPKLMDEIIELGRGYVTFKSIYISSTGIRIEAASATVGPVSAFVESLKAHPEIKSISIDKVENKTSSTEVAIAVSAEIKNPKAGMAEDLNSETARPFDDLKTEN